MRVHVTGGSGFLGRYVVKRLAQEGHQVTALARSEAAAQVVRNCGAEPVRGDLDVPESLTSAFSVGSPEAIVNVASLGFGHAPHIVAAAETSGVDRVVFLSTTAIFTRLPAKSKRVRVEAEAVIERSSLSWTTLRPTMIYGAPGDRNMERLLHFLRRTRIVPLPGGGWRLQQPVHVEDVAQAAVRALDRPLTARRAFDLPGPQPIMLREIVSLAAQAVGRKPYIVPIPLGPVLQGARLYEKVSARPRLRVEQLERLAEDKVFDPGPAVAELAFSPRSFESGILAEAKAVK